MVYLPGEIVGQMRKEAEEVLKEGEWVSDHDLVMAFLLKVRPRSVSESVEAGINVIFVSTHKTTVTAKPSQTYTLNRTLDSRCWLPSIFNSKTYLGVATTYTRLSLPVTQIISESLPSLALLLRQSLITNCTPTEIQKYYNMVRTYRRNGSM